MNTDAAARGLRGDVLRDLDGLLVWLTEHEALEAERAWGIRRRAALQPAAASAALAEAKRVRSALRAFAVGGNASASTCDETVLEINRVLGRSAGTRRIDRRENGTYARAFAATGDAFAGLMIPIVESAADTLIQGDLRRVRECASPRCHQVFVDATKNGMRRWCDMGTCGNRAKAARHRASQMPRASGLHLRTVEGG